MPSHAWNVFWIAIHSLMGVGSIQDRLFGAYDALKSLRGQKLPEFIATDFEHMFMELSDEGSKDTDVRRKVSHMSDPEALIYAEKILDMYDAIARTEKPLLEIPAGSDPAHPDESFE